MKRLWSWLTRPFRRNHGKTPIYPQWETSGPGSWTLPDFAYPAEHGFYPEGEEPT